MQTNASYQVEGLQQFKASGVDVAMIEFGKKPRLVAPFYTKNDQDRLGTNIGKALKKRHAFDIGNELYDPKQNQGAWNSSGVGYAVRGKRLFLASLFFWCLICQDRLRSNAERDCDKTSFWSVLFSLPQSAMIPYLAAVKEAFPNAQRAVVGSDENVAWNEAISTLDDVRCSQCSFMFVLSLFWQTIAWCIETLKQRVVVRIMMMMMMMMMVVVVVVVVMMMTCCSYTDDDDII